MNYLKRIYYFLLFILIVKFLVLVSNNIFNLSLNFYNVLLFLTLFKVLFNELKIGE